MGITPFWMLTSRAYSGVLFCPCLNLSPLLPERSTVRLLSVGIYSLPCKVPTSSWKLKPRVGFSNATFIKPRALNSFFPVHGVKDACPTLRPSVLIVIASIFSAASSRIPSSGAVSFALSLIAFSCNSNLLNCTFKPSNVKPLVKAPATSVKVATGPWLRLIARLLTLNKGYSAIPPIAAETTPLMVMMLPFMDTLAPSPPTVSRDENDEKSEEVWLVLLAVGTLAPDTESKENEDAVGTFACDGKNPSRKFFVLVTWLLIV